MISIITPTNRFGKCFEITFLSVITQTYKDFEWVLLDNSPDGYLAETVERLKINYHQYSDMFNKIKVYRETLLHQPIGYYKNKCVELSSCGENDYILCLDHDDYLVTTALEDISGCDMKYKDKIDCICGDYSCCYSLIKEKELEISFNCKYNRMVGFNYKIASDNQINIGNEINDKVSSYTAYGYDISKYTTIMLPHPKAIRKHWLHTPIFRFYEGHKYEDDGLQIGFIPLLLNIGWIARPTVIYNIVEDNGEIMNCSKRGYPDIESITNHWKIENARSMAFGAFNYFYRDEDKYREFYRYDDFLKKEK